ncbi:DUF192 domain-containing protein [Methyloceanibacter sp. wino2]|uniref:DUF192 domain-containing protein n=1 Tax=Methyloceanibacter sp. wino2 TaxID=2170729 RepID=UPI001FDEFAB4|nr:DUF192 domain-containing protein [Methyloceanibacter sp. wino2]
MLSAWLAAVLVLAALAPATAEEDTVPLVLKTDSGDHTYSVEVADSPGEKARGLMFRRSLPQDHGMIFLYDPPQAASMWMQNTYIPLDMIFITEQGTVLRIEANTEPFSKTVIDSGGIAEAVLELNAGEAARIGLKPGDQVVFPGLGSEPARELEKSGTW